MKRGKVESGYDFGTNSVARSSSDPQRAAPAGGRDRLVERGMSDTITQGAARPSG
jgi:hypothetical protein